MPESQRNSGRKQDAGGNRDPWPVAGTGNADEMITEFGGEGDFERRLPPQISGLEGIRLLSSWP